MFLSRHRVRVATGSEDEEGVLVTVDGRLIAVLVRMDADYHAEQRGWWHQEAGFGACDARPAAFPTLDDALRWIASRLGGDAESARAAVGDPLTAAGTADPPG